MIQRLLEPEVMDTREEAMDYDSMDHEDVNGVFARDFNDARNPKDGFQLIDLGTGTALIPIQICNRHPSMHITGVDLADSMLDLGRHHVARFALSPRIELCKADAKNLPFPENHFDGAFSNSIAHHIPDPVKVFQEMIRVTKPGGLMFMRDLLRPLTEEALKRIVKLHTNGATDRQKALFAASLHAALTEQEVKAIVNSLGYPPRTVRQSSDRHWTWIARKP
ncbi:MAG: methyltransferase domain-containing protein [Gemmataceae bacterium]|nr:methyltransferase domain-containing protein [Gemmataceae bacterium]